MPWSALRHDDQIEPDYCQTLCNFGTKATLLTQVAERYGHPGMSEASIVTYIRVSSSQQERSGLLGPDVDPFMLHLCAALAEKERALISTHTRQALAAAKARGVTLGGPKLQVARKSAMASIKAEADRHAAGRLRDTLFFA